VELFCQYRSVAYFVCRRDASGVVEAVIEVESAEEGAAIMRWLEHTPYVCELLGRAGNDNL
jgi:hypothetical protein